MDVRRTAREIVRGGRGILAADESTPTIGKRFKALGIENTEENRRDYRHALFTAPGSEAHLGGAILYDETLRQVGPDGIRLNEHLAKRGILPGIKVDTGAKDLAACPGEKVTEGLDGLRERLAEYVGLGARFTKWRAVITIGDGRPSAGCMDANAHALARYAALAQEAGLVPIVEPEVLMDGEHGIDGCETATVAALDAVFAALRLHRVDLAGMLLKPSMIIAGKDAKKQAGPDEVARRTVDVLRRCVPAAVPGIVFLSGGQGPEQATDHLARMNQLGPHPWILSFSYGRALQEPALAAWAKGRDAKAARTALLLRTKANFEAAQVA